METTTTVYAHWTPYYVVSFDLNGHGTNAPEPQKIIPGQKATRPAVDPTDPDGAYDFINWVDGPTSTSLFDFDQIITMNTTVFAQ